MGQTSGMTGSPMAGDGAGGPDRFMCDAWRNVEGSPLTLWCSAKLPIKASKCGKMLFFEVDSCGSGWEISMWRWLVHQGQEKFARLTMCRTWGLTIG